jgi:ssDNA-binding Zn-finger/Zn-ribbon topoisomerase 1
MAAVSKAGIGFTIARLWTGTRHDERKLKNRRNATVDLCPVCEKESSSRPERYYVVTCKGFPDTRHEVLARDRRKATYQVAKKAQAAGYRIPWTDFKAVLA